MLAVLAALPIGLVLVAMAGFGWRAATAGLLGLAAALLLAVFPFGLGTDIYPQLGPMAAAGGAMLEGVFVATTILWIIFPALCIFEMQARCGAFRTIRASLARLSDDPRILALLVAWFFGLFMEGVAGFGTPVALAAPILVGLGFTPVRAVSLTLIGHAAGVSFGAVGTPVLPQMAATGLGGAELALAPALLHSLLGWSLAACLYALAGDARMKLGGWGWAAMAALLFFAPYLLLAALVGPELPTIGGAIIGGGVFAMLVRRFAPGAAAGGGPAAPQVVRAALPYLVLLVVVLVTRLAPPLGALRDLALEWSLFDAFAGRFEPLYHPGSMLFLGFVLGGLLQGRTVSELLFAMASAWRRLVWVAVALVAMLGLSRLLVHAEMIDALAQAAAASGGFWPVLAPMVGVLGTFVTGSATSSNILFAEFQQATATALSLPVVTLQGAQSFGAAIGNIVSPHNIIAGAATVALASGREGEVLRVTAVICIAYALAGGVVTALLV